MLGKKTGIGFYTYTDDGKVISLNGHITEEITVLISRMTADALKANSNSPDKTTESSSIPAIKGKRELQNEIVDRCVLIMINEAAYILSEKLVTSPEEIDIAMVFGTGFAPFTGGLLSYADFRGVKSIVDRLLVLTRTAGTRFQPHPLLIDMSKRNARFFPNRPSPEKLQPITTLPRSRL
jgi:3-hydroxyacyl-CoA dehydrogenase